MIRSVQSLFKAQIICSSRPVSGSFIQKSFISGWFGEDKLKAKKEREKKIDFAERYESYPDFSAHTPSPYKNDRGIRKFFENIYHTSGVLPRPEGEDFENKPLPMPQFNTHKNTWNRKAALFGQNDYIDILGDGKIHPWELHVAPMWLKGFSGNELQRLQRMMAMQGNFYKDTFPVKYHQIQKQIKHLSKKLNKRTKDPMRFGGYRRHSRIDKPLERY